METIRGLGVDALPFDAVDVEPPFCPHGPTLLFERYYASKKPRRFFACSVHRNRRGCPFFQWADEPIPKEKRERWMAIFRESEPNIDRTKLLASLAQIKSLPPSQCYYCYQCNLLFTESEFNAHSEHPFRKEIHDSCLLEPTRLLTPVDNRKSQAQFYFSDSSLQFLVDELTRLEFTRVLCVGTPRLHEVLNNSNSIDSLLLDIDHRYAQFFSPDKYQRFNMFTCYFHGDDGRRLCEQFLTSSLDKVAIVIDPPFGGLANVLAAGLKGLWAIAKTELTTFLVFPYFMESHVTTALPSLWMMDYQVTYDNHKHFSERHKDGSKPSPVRIFTNLPRPGLQLPATQGYHLCVLCNRYVARENSHCETCNCCPSKNGRQYSHCFLCGECVKPGRVHCSTCNKCELPNHECSPRATVGCHVCGSLEHKRRDCPKRNQLRKRKSTGSKPGMTKRHKA